MSNRIYTLQIALADEQLKPVLARFHNRKYGTLAETRRVAEAIELLYPEARCRILSTGDTPLPAQKVLRASLL